MGVNFLWVGMGWCELFMGGCGGCDLFMGGCGMVWVGMGRSAK